MFKAPAIPKYLHIGYLRVAVSPYIPNPLRCINTHCAALNVKNLFTAKMHAEEGRPAPRVVKLATPAVIAQVNQSAPTALAITLPSARAVQNGNLRKSSSK